MNLFPLKQGRERLPEVIKNQRNGEEEAGVDGQFQKGQKGFRDVIGDQIGLKGGIPEMAQNRFREEITQDSDQEKGDEDL
jgi:hypothetical protein